jgi:hypothetical protein
MAAGSEVYVWTPGWYELDDEEVFMPIQGIAMEANT